MAKFEGIFEIQGTLKGMTFYKTKDGMLIRTKGGVSRNRIKTDPALQRTRENGAEFAHLADCGQLIRKGLGNMLKLAKDRRMSSRMMGALSKVKNLDLTSPRGERKVQLGLVSPEGKALLSGFNFNKEARFDSVFRALYTLDTTTGTFEVPDFQVSEMLKVPEGTTHVSLSDAVSRVDFEARTICDQHEPENQFGRWRNSGGPQLGSGFRTHRYWIFVFLFATGIFSGDKWNAIST